MSYIKEADNPKEKAFISHLYIGNAPISADAYELILKEASKGGKGGFALRYDSTPMTMFNPQGVYNKPFYNRLQKLTPKEQVKEINHWMRSIYHKARPSYIDNGQVFIPRPLLVKIGN